MNIKHSFKFGNATHKADKATGNKLSWDNVNAIRALHKTGRFSNVQISKMFDMGSSAIDNIINNKSWIIEN